jgi:hypothetical protein
VVQERPGYFIAGRAAAPMDLSPEITEAVHGISSFYPTDNQVSEDKRDNCRGCDCYCHCERKSNSSTDTMFLSMPKVLALPRSRYCMSNDKQTDTKAQKPNPMTRERSQARISTMLPPLNLASAAPFDRLSKEGGLSLRSEGAVISTMDMG